MEDGTGSVELTCGFQPISTTGLVFLDCSVK
jgi:hypothetical protein